jgi:hypothetical protein
MRLMNCTLAPERPAANVALFAKAAVLTAGLLVSASAGATTLYDNLGATPDGADPVVRPSGPLYDSFSSAATPQSLTSLQLELFGPGSSGTLTVGLYSDTSKSPGSLITTLGTIDDSTITSGYNLYTVSLLSTPTLAANTRYWIGLSDSGTGSEAWSWSLDTTGTGVAGEYFANQDGVFPSSEGAYMMGIFSGPPAPGVPDVGGTGSLLAVALAGLMTLRRKLA